MIQDNMTKSQLISPADGRVAETLADPRVLATVLGVVAGNAVEKAAFRGSRQMFGYAVPGANGKVVYYEGKADGSGADTSKPQPQYQTNRNLARAVTVVGCVAAIEYTNNGPAQYGFLGAGAVLLAHIIQDAVPALR